MDRERARTLHNLLVVVLDVDAEPAARIEGCDRLLRALSVERAAIEAATQKSIRSMIAGALTSTRSDLKRAQTRRKRSGVA